MRRREFITVVGGAAVAGWPFTAHGQQRRVAFLTGEAADDPEVKRFFKAMTDGLASLGWKSGENISIDVQGIGGNVDLVEHYVQDAVAAGPDVIVSTSGPVLVALEKQTRTIPIVFLEVTDPVASGFVKSLAKPDGNVTGFTNFQPEFGGKWLEILSSLAPRLARVVVMLNPDVAPQVHMLQIIGALALRIGMVPITAGVHNASDIMQVVSTNAPEADRTGMIVLPSPITIANRQTLVQAANTAKLPTIYPNRYFAEIGGLVSYGIDQAAQFRQAASYVDRILKGEKPADLPVQAPTKFELVINIQTAKALALAVPQSLLATADEVIE